jgi:hypothetical protein
LSGFFWIFIDFQAHGNPTKKIARDCLFTEEPGLYLPGGLV